MAKLDKVDDALKLGGESIWARIARLRINSVSVLAPLFRARLAEGLLDCCGVTVRQAEHSLELDPFVFETARENELQAIYYAQGASRAKTVWNSWHGYRLAADIISKRYEWFDNTAARRDFGEARFRVGDAWFHAMAERMKARGLAWGGDWPGFRDQPHVQFGKPMRRSPSPRAKQLYDQGGYIAVWREVGALGEG